MLEKTTLAEPEDVTAKLPAVQFISHDPSLDLLRGLSALAVAVPHFLLLSGDAHPDAETFAVIAVEVFFVLSGFVLGPQILLVLHGNHDGALRTFLVRRWMRTVPSYLLALLLISILAGELQTTDAVRYLLYVQNLWSQHNDADYFPVAWSLSVEEWFYLIFPGAMLIVARIAGWRHPAQYALAALVFIALVTAARGFFPDWTDWGSNVRRVTAFRVDSIAYGFLLYLAVRRRGPAGLVVTAPLFAIAAAAIYADLRIIEVSDGTAAKAAFPFLAALFGSSAILFSLSLPKFSSFARRASAFLATISYAVYLYHLIILQLMSRLAGPGESLTRFAIYVAATIFVAALISFVVEQPILTVRPRYRPRVSKP